MSAVAPSADSRTAVSALASSTLVGPRRLLVVTASADTRAMLLGLIERSESGPVLVTVVSGASEAVRRLRGGRFTAAIVDATTPHAGWSTLGRVCDANPGTPVLVLAPTGDEILAADAVRLGAQEILFRERLTPFRLDLAIACAAERARKLAELRDLSLTDALTGLYNRRGFLVLADAHLRMLRRTGSRSLLIVADVDRLKDVNDRHGHAAGDRAIVHAAEALRATLRDSDVVARYGGDEFVALAHDVTEGASMVLVSRITAALADLDARDHVPFTVSLSIGTATIEPNGLDLETILARADRELYRSKRRRSRRRADVDPVASRRLPARSR